MRLPIFDRPLIVLVGLGFPRQVQGLRDALDVLEEHPALLRDEAYEAALATCRATCTDEGTAQEAHDVFAAFARRRGMLVDEPLAEMAMAARDELMRA